MLAPYSSFDSSWANSLILGFSTDWQKISPEKQSLKPNSRINEASREGPGNRQYGRVEKPLSKDALVNKYATPKLSDGNYRNPPKAPLGGDPRTSSGNMAREAAADPAQQPPQPSALIDLHTAPSATPQQLNNTDRTGFTLNWDSMKSGLQNFGTKRFAPMRQERAQLQPTSSQTLDSIFQGLGKKREATDEEDGLDLRLLR